MRNLALCEHRRYAVSPLPHHQAALSPTVSTPGQLCVDPVTRTVYHVNSSGIQTLTNTSDGGFAGLTWEDHGVSIEHIIKADIITATSASSLSASAICIVTEGNVITAEMDPVQTDVVGTVSAGISAACWSPDLELLVLVMRDNSLIIMTSDFDPVTEIGLDSQEFGERKFVDVGWGRKETQFHGSAGKGAAKKVDVSVSEVPHWDDRRPRISWRGDGHMFVVGFVRGDTRCLKVVSREGVLQATSEQLPGLEQPIAWKPSGSLIASSQRLAHKLDVIFFEKNGLKHGEFSLPFKSDEVFVKELMWNQDSSVLLLWIQPCSADSRGKLPENVLQLWTTSNYHWFLKQELTFREVVHVSWDNEDPFLMYLLTVSHFHCFNWSFHTDLSTGSDIHDHSCVAVIDGKKVNVTPLRHTVIPPPMSAYEVTFPDPINCVMFAPTDKNCDPSPENSLDIEDSGFLESCESPSFNSNDICVFHGSDTLTFLTQAQAIDVLDDHGCCVKVGGAGGNGFTVNTKVHRIAAQHKLIYDLDCTEKVTNFRHLYNWTWAAKNTILTCYNEENESFIAVLEMQGIGTESGTIRVKELVPIESSVISLATAANTSFVALQLASGAVLKFDSTTGLVEPYMINGNEVIFPGPCRRVCLCPVDEQGSQLVPLGLSPWNRLYLGNCQLFPNCTSFHIHNNFLLVTTTNHKLHIVPLVMTTLTKVAEGKIEEFVGSRRIERGARIVTAISQDTRVVLQMPRGNLEVISPRALAVYMVKQLLNDLKYNQAIDMMRKQRIDLNLLYDHNPSEFLEHVKHFVEDVRNPQWIDLFIANLNERDCTSSMYSFNYNSSANHAAGQNDNNAYNSSTNHATGLNDNNALGNKIETVCKAVREAMISVSEDDYLLPILTSYVRMVPSQMDIALRKIKNMKDAQNKSFSISADEGLRHLLYIADVNELYNVALGTYDFDLVMMVAEKSQKDPKEYLPFLNELRLLDEQYRKFKINIHLRQFKKALECHMETEGFEEECLDLIIREKLYKDALQVFPASSNLARLVCEHYGNYLVSKNYFSEAALMFSRANKLEKALNTYKQAGLWRMVLVVAEQLNFDVVVMQNLCVELVKSLKDKNQYKEAAWVYEYYLKNEEDALDCLVKASEWEEALRVAYKHRRQDLIDTHIRPGILEQLEVCMAAIERIANTITLSTSRLATVREIKHKEHLSFLDGDTEGILDSDLYSDTSTVAGVSLSRTHSSTQGSSIKTYRSTKNKRKLERKKYSLKEGSAYEDVGLVAALHELFVSADNLAGSISSLCTMLIIFGSDQDARTLQESYAGLLTLMESKKNEIWPTSTNQEVEFGPELTTEGAVSKMRGGGVDESTSLIALRMRELEPQLRHPPPPSRTSSWRIQLL